MAAFGWRGTTKIEDHLEQGCWERQKLKGGLGELEYSQGSKADLRMQLPYVSTDVTRVDVDGNDDDDDDTEDLMKI